MSKKVSFQWGYRNASHSHQLEGKVERRDEQKERQCTKKVALVLLLRLRLDLRTSSGNDRVTLYDSNDGKDKCCYPGTEDHVYLVHGVSIEVSKTKGREVRRHLLLVGVT